MRKMTELGEEGVEIEVNTAMENKLVENGWEILEVGGKRFDPEHFTTSEFVSECPEEFEFSNEEVWGLDFNYDTWKVTKVTGQAAALGVEVGYYLVGIGDKLKTWI